jgi:hypothetical protein
MHVEVHGDYSVEDCIADLAKLGFAATHDSRRPTAVTAFRR